MTAERPDAEAVARTVDQPSPAGRPGMGLLKAYGVVYLLLLAGYVIFSMTGGVQLTPEKYFEAAFNLPEAGLPNAAALPQAYDEKDGHLLVWDEIVFSVDGVEYRIPADERLNRTEAVGLGRAVLTAPEGAAPEIWINKYNVPFSTWAYGMTVYNLLGMYLLIVIFLREPIGKMLSEKAQTAALALSEARDAKAEAERLKAQYEALLAEVKAERDRLEKTAADELAEEREHILKTAKHEAEGMMDSLREGLDAELAYARARLKTELAREVLAEARAMVTAEAGVGDHAAAVDSLVDQLRKAKVG